MTTAVAESKLTVNEELDLLLRGTAEVIDIDELSRKLERSRKEGRPLRVKAGFDITASDLHVGNAIVLHKMRQFQDLGHQVVFLIGDFTGKIGDPSGKSEARPVLSQDQVEENIARFREQYGKILDIDKTEVRYNSEWFENMPVADFMALASKYTVARLLERDDFAKRYEQNLPLSMAEMLYPIIQGYDSVALQADVELGGTDQKFNMLVGRHLQRACGQESQVVMMTPLIEGLDGKEKMSKSLGNYIGINESPSEIYGKTMSISDDMILRYLEFLTTVPLDETGRLKEELESGTNPKLIKQRLAREIVARYWDKEAAGKAEEEFERVFAQKGLPDELTPVSIVPSDLKEGKIWIVRLIVKAGFAASNGEARRFVRGGSVRLDGEVVGSEDFEWTPKADTILQVGKRRFGKIELA